MHWFVEAFRKYADFSGRARRIEYWMFHLFNWIALVLLILVLMPGSSAPSEFVASFSGFTRLPSSCPRSRLRFAGCMTLTTAGGGSWFPSPISC